MPDKKDVKPIPKGLVPIIKPVMRWIARANVWIYRQTGGRVGGSFNGSPVCLVTMTGRKSGRELTIPLIHIPHGDDILLVASQGGMDMHPVWYHNLVAHPDVEIQVGWEKRPMRVRQASAEEKKKLWPVACAVYPDFDDYQARTDRDIPVMICEPR